MPPTNRLTNDQVRLYQQIFAPAALSAASAAAWGSKPSSWPCLAAAAPEYDCGSFHLDMPSSHRPSSTLRCIQWPRPIIVNHWYLYLFCNILKQLHLHLLHTFERWPPAVAPAAVRCVLQHGQLLMRKAPGQDGIGCWLVASTSPQN